MENFWNLISFHRNFNFSKYTKSFKSYSPKSEGIQILAPNKLRTGQPTDKSLL